MSGDDERNLEEPGVRFRGVPTFFMKVRASDQICILKVLVAAAASSIAVPWPTSGQCFPVDVLTQLFFAQIQPLKHMPGPVRFIADWSPPSLTELSQVTTR